MKPITEEIMPNRPLDVPPLLPHQPANIPAMPVPFVHVYKRDQWEYRRILCNLAQVETLSEDELNTLGAEGWELTTAINDSTSIYFYFKRPVH